MTRKHARNAPSAWARWSACPGSISFTEALQAEGAIGLETSNAYADEGSAMHAAAAWCLDMDLDAADVIGEVFEDFTDFPIDEERAATIQVYLDYVRRQAGERYVEQALYIGPISDEGHVDCVLVSPDGQELVVIDFKGGRGVKVFAEDNGQLMLYAYGALARCGGRTPARVRTVIVQPRLDHIDEWTCSYGELIAFGDFARDAVARTVSPDAARIPGAAQCKFCPAKALCPELAAWSQSTAASGPSGSLTAEQLGEILPRLATIEDWVEAVRSRAHAELMAGAEIPGFKLVAGRAGARKWGDPAAAEALLKSFRLGVDEMYEKTVISPTAAEKLLAEASPRRWAKAQPLIVRADPKPTVVPAADKRPATVINPIADQIPDLTDAPVAPAETEVDVADLV